MRSPRSRLGGQSVFFRIKELSGGVVGVGGFEDRATEAGTKFGDRAAEGVGDGGGPDRGVRPLRAFVSDGPLEAVGIAVYVGLRALAVAFGVGGFAVRIGVGCACREESVRTARRGDEVQAVRRTVGGRGFDAVWAARPDEATGAVVAALRGLRETARGRGRGENAARGVVGRGRNDLGTGERVGVGRGDTAAETVVGVGCADAVGTG